MMGLLLSVLACIVPWPACLPLFAAGAVLLAVRMRDG